MIISVPITTADMSSTGKLRLDGANVVPYPDTDDV